MNGVPLKKSAPIIVIVVVEFVYDTARVFVGRLDRDVCKVRATTWIRINDRTLVEPNATFSQFIFKFVVMFSPLIFNR